MSGTGAPRSGSATTRPRVRAQVRDALVLMACSAGLSIVCAGALALVPLLLPIGG